MGKSATFMLPLKNRQKSPKVAKNQNQKKSTVRLLRVIKINN